MRAQANREAGPESGPAGEPGAQPGSKQRRGWKRSILAPLRHGALIIVLALIVEYLVVPELVGASKDLYLLGRLNAAWMVLGVVLEAASLFCYALMNRVLLPPGGPSLGTLYRIDLAAAAVAHVIPAGTIGSAGIGYRLFTAEGIKGTDVGVMMATKGLGSTVVLNVLLWVSLVVSIPLAGFRPVYLTVAIIGAVALAAVAGLVLAVTRGQQRGSRIARGIGARIPGVGADRLEGVFRGAGVSLSRLASSPSRLRWTVIWAALNWLLDAASLWCFVAAFGGFANPVELFAAYGIANVAGALPVTPAGLGVIDSLAPLLLVSFGLTRSVATLGVLAWRLVNFWLPIPAGAISYITLKVPRGAGWQDARRAVAEMVARGTARFSADSDTDDGEDSRAGQGPGDGGDSGASPAGGGPAGGGPAAAEKK